jgi:hypothetical protein
MTGSDEERERRRRAIDPERIAGVTPIIYDDAERRGVRALQLRNAVGLALTLVVDRGLDASELLFRGIPLTWYGPGNAAPPEAVDPGTDAFDRTFFGGLVTTCGMDAFGPPGKDRWGSWPQHGHFNRTVARHVRYLVDWSVGAATIDVSGSILQFRMFGSAYRIERTWSMKLDENVVTLRDRVSNDGGEAVPHMVLYHCNIGFPMLSEQTSWELEAIKTRPRDAVAAAAMAVWNVGGPPEAHFKEQVFLHYPVAGADCFARATATNTSVGAALTIAYRPEQLPALFTWRMLGYGTYVMAAEPANTPAIDGRLAAAVESALPILAPGESRSYELRFSVADAVNPTVR